MKKIFFTSALITIVTAGAALAEGMVFDPSEFVLTDSTPSKTTTSAIKDVSGQTNGLSNSAIESSTKKSSTYAQDTVSGQSSNFNNALYELDSAQVNIRNELLDYKAKYQEIDTQYKLIKEQRRVLGEQIKSVEKRIKSIERSKSQIRKTMI